MCCFFLRFPVEHFNDDLKHKIKSLLNLDEFERMKNPRKL